MSYLDQFLKETNSNQQQAQMVHQLQQSFDTGSVQGLLYQSGSMESEDGDIEDNRAISINSSRSNISENVSMVSLFNNIVFFLLMLNTQ